MQKITSPLVVVFALCLLGFVFSAKLNDPVLINAINNHPRASWKAKAYPMFEGKVTGDISHLLGAILPTTQSRFYSEPKYKYKGSAIPTSFDSSKKWPEYIHPIRNQFTCASCWAFSSSEMLSDRFAIATNGSVNVVLSPQYQVSCDKSNDACEGGNWDFTLWKFLSSTGTVSESCWPYVSGDGTVPPCRNICVDGSRMKFYKSDNRTVKNFASGDVQAMQEDIMQHGPIMTGFMIYQDFLQYRSGVYRHMTGRLVGGHAVKITGWGVDSASGLPYWIAANSWGEGWGQNGFFWMLRGKDDCQFETYAYTALPLLE